MPDNSYKIKFELEKGDVSSVSEDLKKLMGTFQDVSKSLKPLADSFNTAFGPKTLESLTKITSIFSNLERTLDSLSNKTDRFGSTIERVAGGRGMQQISGANRGVIFDQFGRPMASDPVLAAVGGDAGPSPAGAPAAPAGGGLGSLARAAGRLGIPGASAMGELASGMSPAMIMASNAALVAGGGLMAYNTGYDTYYKTQAAMLQGERMGRASAMAGRPGERFVLSGAGQLGGTDYARALSGSALTFGASIAAGAAAGSLIPGLGTLAGAIGGGIYGAGKGISGYFDTINNIRQQKLNLNAELGQAVDRTMDYTSGVEGAELIYGAGATDATISGGGGYGGLDRRTDLLNRMARSGMRLGTAGTSRFDAMMALENRYNLGGISAFGMRSTANLADFDIEGFKRVVAESGYGGIDQISARGAISDSVMGMAAQRGIYNQGTAQNLLGMGFSFAAPYQNMSTDFQQRVSSETFGRRSGAMQSGFGQAFMHQKLFSMGIKNPFAAQAIQTNLESGNIDRAMDIAKDQGVSLSKADLNGLVSGSMGGAQQVLKATGLGAEYVGDIFTGDEAQQASIRNVLSGRAAGTMGRSAAGGRGARPAIEEAVDGRDTRAMQTAAAQMSQFEQVLSMASDKFNEFQTIVKQAGDEFNAAVLKGLKADEASKRRTDATKNPSNGPARLGKEGTK
jgi:hypothetical protein